MMSPTPASPANLAPAGTRLRSSVVDDYELDEHELALLVQACRTVDLLDELPPSSATEYSSMGHKASGRTRQ